MKLRKGFVSNSSSSSFICDMCGHDESGMDMCLSEASMFECVNGHILCTDHAIGELDDSYDVPIENCPVCSLSVVIDHDMLNYLLKKYGITRELVTTEVQNNHKTF